MNLDFSKLDSLGGRTEDLKHKGNTNTLTIDLEATQDNTEGKTYHKIEREKDDREKISKVYADHQDNIHKGGMLREQINIGMKAAKSNEDLDIILLQAIECISLMTGDKMFFTSNRTKLELIRQTIGMIS